MSSDGGIVSCFTGVVSLIWNVPLTIFEGDGEASAAGVYRRAHIASFHSNAALAPADSDTTVAPIMMPRMVPSANPSVPEVSIRRAPAPRARRWDTPARGWRGPPARRGAAAARRAAAALRSRLCCAAPRAPAPHAPRPAARSRAAAFAFAAAAARAGWWTA
jgi:hypothetical protein